MDCGRPSGAAAKEKSGWPSLPIFPLASPSCSSSLHPIFSHGSGAGRGFHANWLPAALNYGGTFSPRIDLLAEVSVDQWKVNYK